MVNPRRLDETRHKERRPMTKPDKDRYIADGGVNCPYCQSADIAGESIEIDGKCAYQDISCLACGKKWRDLYGLFDVMFYDE